MCLCVDIYVVVGVVLTRVGAGEKVVVTVGGDINVSSSSSLSFLSFSSSSLSLKEGIVRAYGKTATFSNRFRSPNKTPKERVFTRKVGTTTPHADPPPQHRIVRYG